MEEYYKEYILDCNTPVIIRIDVLDLDKYTGILSEPYDFMFHNSFIETVLKLSKSIPNFRFAFLGYDNAFLLLLNTDELWLNYDIQPIICETSSHCITTFNKIFATTIVDTTGYYDDIQKHRMKISYNSNIHNELLYNHDIYNKYKKLKNSLLRFKVKVYSIPIIKVIDYLICRQEEYNINMFKKYAKSILTEEELKDKTDLQLFEILDNKGVSFIKQQQFLKTGICFSKKNNYILDLNVPLFSKDREYVADSMINGD